MALEMVKVASAESIGEWLQISGKCTVGKFRELVKEAKGTASTAPEEPKHCLLTVA